MHTEKKNCTSFSYTRDLLRSASHATYESKHTTQHPWQLPLSTIMQCVSQSAHSDKLPTITDEIATQQHPDASTGLLATLSAHNLDSEGCNLRKNRVSEALERVAAVAASGKKESSVHRDHDDGLITPTGLILEHMPGLHLPNPYLSCAKIDTLTASICDAADSLATLQLAQSETLGGAPSPRAEYHQPSQSIRKRGRDKPQASHDATHSTDPTEVHGIHQFLPSPRLAFHQKDLSDKDFRREALLGQGSYSIVTSATHLPSGRLFALKEISRFHLCQNGMDRQLQWEINVHRKLRHPNVVRLYSYYVTPQYIHLVLEYCPQGTILQRLRAAPGGRLDELHASRYARHVARALEHLHRNSIAHRDLKLENVLLDQRGVAKLADFGWSKVVCAGAEGEGGGWPWLSTRRDVDVNVAEAEEEPHRPGSRGSAVSARSPGPRFTVCGTLDYLSPEMVSAQPHTAKTDIWSLGAMIVEMLTGEPPFYHASQQETLEAIRTKAPNLCGRRSLLYTRPKDIYSETDEEKAVEGNSFVAGSILQDEMPVRLSPLAQNLVLSMLNKSPDERPTIEQVLQHPWLTKNRS